MTNWPIYCHRVLRILAKDLKHFQGCHGQGKVREKRNFFKVREKSGTFLKSQGKSLILAKSVKSLNKISARVFNTISSEKD